MLIRSELPYPIEDIRRALRTWAFSDRLRGATDPPDDQAAVVHWLKTATVPVSELAQSGAGAACCRALLERISRKQDGTAAAANTPNRKRAVLNNLTQYAVETGALPVNPPKTIKWTRPRALKNIDPRTVVNSDQARRLLTAVGQQGERGERMVAFFGCMYYAALRPEEIVELRPREPRQPPGERLGRIDPDRRRELKHRPRGETWPVPIHPELVALLSSTSRSARQAQMGASSPALAAASSTTALIPRSSTRPGLRRSLAASQTLARI